MNLLVIITLKLCTEKVSYVGTLVIVEARSNKKLILQVYYNSCQLASAIYQHVSQRFPVISSAHKLRDNNDGKLKPVRIYSILDD